MGVMPKGSLKRRAIISKRFRHFPMQRGVQLVTGENIFLDDIGEQQGLVQKPVNARACRWARAIKRGRVWPGQCRQTHDAVRFKYAHCPVFGEGRGNITERVGAQKSVRFIKRTRKPGFGRAAGAGMGLLFRIGHFDGFIIPQPIRHFGGLVADHINHGTGIARHNRCLIDARVRQIGNNTNVALVAHIEHSFYSKPHRYQLLSQPKDCGGLFKDNPSQAYATARPFAVNSNLIKPRNMISGAL